MKKQYFLIVVLLIYSASAFAEIPRTISYQGLLTDTETGEPLTGNFNLTFRLYTFNFCDDDDITYAIWEETHENVQLSNGIFNVILGINTALDEQTVTFNQPYCIGISVGEAEELAPRIPLTSSPYSLNPQEFPVPLHLRERTDGVALIKGNNISSVANSIGVKGIHETSGNYGFLGHDDYGVYGYLNNDHFGLGAVYGKADNGNIGFLADQWYGVYSYHDESENEAYLTSDEYAFFGQNPLGKTNGFIGGDNIAVEGNQYTDNDLLNRMGRLATEEYGVYGEQYSNYRTMGYLAGTLAGAYGESLYSGRTNYGCLACTADLIDRIGDVGTSVHSCGVFGYEGDNNNWGYIAYEDAGVFGVYTNKGHKGWLGDVFAGVHGVNESTGNYGYLACEDAGAKGIGNDYGIIGFSSTGTGAYGRNESTGNYGELGHPASGAYGKYSPNGNFGYLGNTSYGAYGQYNPNGNHGFLGGSEYGAYGKHNPNGNFGYLGSSNYGAYGEYANGNYGALGLSNRGVYGESSTGFAVRGYYSNDENEAFGYLGGFGMGVYGRYIESMTNWGYLGSDTYAGAFGANVYIGGSCSITGTLTKGAGSFKIDHPLDPENKFLSHSFVESPDMMNIYNGNVILDEMGEAVIELPEWFGVINRDFRYQLTCIGGFAQIYIAEEIHNNTFKIAGGTQGLKVSWQITGIRKDPYAVKHPIIVEEEKEEKLRGFYLHPDLYGQPDEKQLEWGRDPEIMKAIQEDNNE